ncbi:MAG: hypothetical protein K0S05_1110 [Agromyces sp.]|nr:hypothetical protein [Agromyces sp.]
MSDRGAAGLREWARRRPPGPERWLLEELDVLQSGAAHRGAAVERDEAIDILLARGVLSPSTAEAARAAPVGSAARVLPPPAAPGPPRPVGIRAHDPGAPVAVALVVVAPLALLLPGAGLLDLGASMWLSTGVLLAGMLVLLLSGGRGSTEAPGGRGRLTSRGVLVVALVGLATPAVTLLAGISAGRFAPEYVGACLAVQAMSVFFLFAASAIVRHQAPGR